MGAAQGDLDRLALAADLWGEDLEPARLEVAAMIRALHDEGHGEAVRVLAFGREAQASAKLALQQSAELSPAPSATSGCAIPAPSSPATAPPVSASMAGAASINCPTTPKSPDQIARASGIALTRHDFILEGGAVEMDGEGTLLTTRQCLINPNRNPDWDEEKAEAALKRALGVKKFSGSMKASPTTTQTAISIISSASLRPAASSAKAPGAMTIPMPACSKTSP